MHRQKSFSALAVAAFAAATLSGCGGGSGGTTPPSCTPSCTGKQCGPDGCDGSCGSCDDGNGCSTDSCSAEGLCSHTALPDGYTLQNLTVSGCASGVEVSFDCRTVCREAGYNVAIGGSASGATPALCTCQSTTCQCGSASQDCSGDTFFCNRYDAGVACDQGANFWVVNDCSTYCQSLGYTGSDGCRPQVGFCTCLGTITFSTGTYTCHGYGGDCSSDYCCSNLACTWFYNGGNWFYACDTPTQCEPRCLQGSVCCGGAFCAGDCIGNPCCS